MSVKGTFRNRRWFGKKQRESIMLKRFVYILAAVALISSMASAQQCELYAPNAFSPDGDGRNEYWQVSLPDSCFIDYTCRIFNRYGEVVWRSIRPDDRWDGGYNSSGYYVQNEQYKYLITYRGIGYSRQLVGTITVIR